MKLVMLESPYAGDVSRNISYARLALRDSLLRGESPIASHLLYTQVLDDSVPEQRQAGLDAGLRWITVADRVVAYVDYGISSGMQRAIDLAEAFNVPVEQRKIL